MFHCTPNGDWLKLGKTLRLACTPHVSGLIFADFMSGQNIKLDVYKRTSIKFNLNGTLAATALTHWGRVAHICVGKLTIIGSDNGLSPGRHQAIIWSNAELLSIGPWGTNFSEMLIEIHTFSLKQMHLKRLSAKWRPLYLVLNVLTLLEIGLPWRSIATTYAISVLTNNTQCKYRSKFSTTMVIHFW